MGWQRKLTDQDEEKFGIPVTAVADLLTRWRYPTIFQAYYRPQDSGHPAQNYQTLDNLLRMLGRLKASVGRAFADQARLSRRLATIKCDVPVEYDPVTLELSDPDRGELADFFRRLNFNRFIQEFELEGDAVPKVAIDRNAYRCITTDAQLEEVCQSIEKAGCVSIDLETTSLSTLDASIVGFALAWSAGEAVYVPVAHEYEGAPEQLALTASCII